MSSDEWLDKGQWWFTWRTKVYYKSKYSLWIEHQVIKY